MTRLDELEKEVLGAARQSMAPNVADRYRVQAGLVGSGELPLQGWDTPLSLVRERQDSGAVLRQPDTSESAPKSPQPPVDISAASTSSVPSTAAAGSNLRHSLLGEAKKAAFVGWVAGGLMGFGLGMAVTRSAAPEEHRTNAASSSAASVVGSHGAGRALANEGSVASEPQQTEALDSDRPGSKAKPSEAGSSQGNAAPSPNELARPPETLADQAPVPRTTSPGKHVRPARHSELQSKSSAGSSQPRSTLALELSMLQRARRALNRGNGQLALGIVLSLDEKVPAGVLMEERSATRILSLCKLGREQQATEHSRRFLALYPRSVYAERVRAGCNATIEGE